MTNLFKGATKIARLLPAEAAHTATIRALAASGGPLVRTSPDRWGLGVTLPKSGLALPNPIGLAAGFDKNAEVFDPMLGFGFGFVECGTVTPRAQSGNPKPRVFRLKADRGVINRLGFNNGGLTPYTARLSKRRPARGVVGANVGANKD
ncbi:MAG: dihydroorotate dehydrogenase (quinone), partial [Pseudomonadota bacterium]